MVQLYYVSMLFVALVFSGIYIYMWHKHFDVNLTMVFVLVPVSCLGYLFHQAADSLNAEIFAQKVIYIGGCYLQLFILLGIFTLCGIQVSRWVRMLLFSICSILYLSVMTIGYTDLFYRSISVENVNGTIVITKEYGWMHTVFYAALVLFFVSTLIVIAYSWIKKRQVPRTIISLLVIPDLVCMVSFFVGRKLPLPVDLVPLGYVLSQLVFLLIAYRLNLYDVSDTVIDSMVQEKSIGYISFDFQYRYLGSNELARTLVPELNHLAVDEILGYKPSERKIRHFLDSFKESQKEKLEKEQEGKQEKDQTEDQKEDKKNNLFVYTLRDKDGNEENDKIYIVNVSFLYGGNHQRGYMVTFTDDTQNRKYINLLDSYNENLRLEVEKKTQHIVEMHDNLIMSLAMMVESRDNSTGGHIKRTSEGVRILVDEIKKEGVLSLSPEFCQDVIKAAPMHDLGKIAVDDEVLRKPGRFTPEEYEIMKNHAAEGARVIHEILAHTDDESFKLVAENVAHYHHERWDGSGYPEGLAGEAIPIEARIMAIADVYDALVSKRVYKDAFDFSKADQIIMEGMGTQFDPGLKTAYEKAKPRLEAYYQASGNAS